MLVVFLRRAGEGPPQRCYWGHLLVLGPPAGPGADLIAWGDQHIASALAAVVNACTPLFAAAFAAWLLGERLRPSQLAGLVVGFFGVGVVAGVGGDDLASSSLAGVLAVVAASAGYSFGFAYAHRFTEGLSALQLLLGQLAAGIFLLAAVAARGVAGGRVDLQPLGLLCLLLLGGLGTATPAQLPHRS